MKALPMQSKNPLVQRANVNRLVDLGVKVIISDLPDVGLTPYAAAQKALNRFGTPELRRTLDELWVGNNPQLAVTATTI